MRTLSFIIVSDNPGEMVKDQIESITRQDLLFNTEFLIQPFNGNYNRALNEGFNQAKGETLFFCNDDLIWHDGSVINLVTALNYYDSVSGWCPKTHVQWWGKQLPQNKFTVGYTTGKIVTGWMIGANKQTIEKIGGFDQRVTFWASDNAYCKQLERANLKHALVSDAHITHLQSQTLNKIKDRRKKEQLTTQQVRIYNKLYKDKLFGL